MKLFANRIYLESKIIVESKVHLNRLIKTFDTDDVNVRVMGISYSMAGERIRSRTFSKKKKKICSECRCVKK